VFAAQRAVRRARARQQHADEQIQRLEQALRQAFHLLIPLAPPPSATI
jgi:hypothetical protein